MTCVSHVSYVICLVITLYNFLEAILKQHDTTEREIWITTSEYLKHAPARLKNAKTTTEIDNA